MILTFVVIFFTVRFSSAWDMPEPDLWCWSIIFFYSKATYMGKRLSHYLLEILSRNTRVLQQCKNSGFGLSLWNNFHCNIFRYNKIVGVFPEHDSQYRVLFSFTVKLLHCIYMIEIKSKKKNLEVICKLFYLY